MFQKIQAACPNCKIRVSHVMDNERLCGDKEYFTADIDGQFLCTPNFALTMEALAEKAIATAKNPTDKLKSLQVAREKIEAKIAELNKTLTLANAATLDQGPAATVKATIPAEKLEQKI